MEIALVDASFLRGSRGEIVPDEGLLYVDKELTSSIEETLEVVAHELGHLLLHHRLLGPSRADLLRGSVFLDQGVPALSRYSPRSQEEAEASAFAAELICPAKEVFNLWSQQPTGTAEELAAHFGTTPDLVRIQLAEGLYRRLIGEPPPTEMDAHPTTPEQEQAATTTGVPVLVDAGPGTGKTKTLVRRIEHLITEKGAAPEQVLVLTFSNEAAAELRERLERTLGTEVASRILASTFHGFGVLLLHALGDRVELDTDYSILDEAAQEEAVAELLGRIDCDPILDLRDPARSASEIAGLIAFLKDRLINPEEFQGAIDSWKPASAEALIAGRAEALLRIFEAYEETKKLCNEVDFADLILLPYHLLRDNEDLRERLRSEFPWVLVDEYQDVSRATALFLQQITSPVNPPWVVGDARQAIYRFRGAEPENVIRFAEDFPGAVTFQLQDNYRSASEIIEAANQLAALLEPDAARRISHRWKPGRKILALGERPVRQVAANSDWAEREGIAEVVKHWLEAGIGEDGIAVLARRNVDVRNIAVVLKQRGIRAVTTGILTAEGAGADLAAVLSAIDRPVAMVRVIFALNRGVPAEVLNTAIRQLLESALGEEEPCWMGSPDAQAIASNGWRVREHLRACLHSEDAWSVLTQFLFFQTDYLRRLLGEVDDAEAAVQIEEILSTLALAAGYRFSHPHDTRGRSRRGFAQRLRHLLTHPAPGLIPPRKQAGAVRVMTCHAAKGLEFPCVVVAGQSLPDLLRRDAFLPPSLRPAETADLLQADSLLFVGVTRAERAVVISHATSASGTRKSRPRKLPKLLEQWLASSGQEPEQWEKPPSSAEEITVRRIWGGETPRRVGIYGLGSSTCRVRIYLEEQLGARFPGRDYPLYPEFIRRVRIMLAQVVQRAFEAKSRVSAAVTEEIADEVWPADAFDDHPHIAIYRPRAKRWAERFAQAFDPRAMGAVALLDEPFEWVAPSGAAAELKLYLIGHFRDNCGKQVAIILRPEAQNREESVAWSDLKDNRLPFVLLQHRDGNVCPLVFFGEDGDLRPFRWSNRKPGDAISREAEEARQAFVNLIQGDFDGTVSDWVCDRCRCRIICPWWIGATTPSIEINIDQPESLNPK